MWELAAIYEACGIPVQLLKASQPGYLLYEDDFQVVVHQPKRRKPPARAPRLQITSV